MIRSWFCSAALVLTFVSPSLGAKPTYQRGKYVDYAQSPTCHDECSSTTASRLYFCFQSGGIFLVGHVKNQTPGYDPLKTASHLDHFVPLRYSADHVWVVLGHGKELRLNRDRSSTVFNESGCNLSPEKRID